MTRLLIAASAAAAVLVAAPGASAASRSCESFDTLFGAVKAKGVTCSYAGKVTTAYFSTKSCTATRVPRRCVVKRLTCTPRKAKGGTRVTCVNKARTKDVRFTIYG